MLVLRPVSDTDAEDLYALTEQAGTGVTSLPTDHAILADKISHSQRVFQKEIPAKNGDTLYFFVLEDLDTGHVVGTSAIDASVGSDIPFYSYKLSHVTKLHHELNIHCEQDILHLTNDYQGYTEICSLLLAAAYRKKNYGRLLSLGRFLFIAQFPERFADIVFAEMRGVFDADGRSPFWEGLPHYFFPMDFATADRLTVTTNKQFIADLMPQHPIYVCLLDPTAQAVIGNVHDATKPAVAILKREGFEYKNYIDIFDGGPVLEARKEKIRTVRKSQLYDVVRLADMAQEKQGLIANTQLDFRVCCGEYHIEGDNRVVLPARVAAALQVHVGDKVRIATIS